MLNLATDVFTDDPSKLPFRWWQQADNSQVETEIPNIKSISWDRSVDTDAASCNIAVYNQKMDPNVSGQNRMLGKPGYFTWHGRDANATARWVNLVENEWKGVLIPNALLRTYEGFGGHDKTLMEAIGDGNLVLTGVWLIDEVKVTSDGLLNLTCRDMCKLLIEQQMYLPFMPPAKYPLAYSRWRYETFFYPAVNAYDRVDPDPNPVQYGPGAEGRKYITDLALDADGGGYGLLGTDGGVFCYNTTFYGSRGQGAVGSVAGMASTSGGDGLWAVNAGGDVFTRGTAVDLGGVTDWPITADISSIVAIEPTHTDGGYWILSDNGWVFPKGDAGTLSVTPPDTSVFLADMARTPNSAGYWILAEDGAVYSYGNAGYHGNATIASGHSATGIVGTLDGGGYYIVADDGAVFALGDATYHGGANTLSLTKPVIDIVLTSTGNGYWLVASDGGVFAFGDAVFHGSLSGSLFTVRAMARTADNGGYWLIVDGGGITQYGNATDFGDVTGAVDAAPMTGYDMDPLGRGYWLAGADGSVFAFGEAVYYGRATVDPNGAGRIWRLVAHPSGRGYWLLGRDGGVFSYGSAGFHGSGSGLMESPAVDMASTPSGNGYWIVSEQGHVFAFGDATYYGNATITSPDKAAGMAVRSQGDGYWICSEKGAIFALGQAPYYTPNSDYATALTNLSDPMIGMDAMPDGDGYLLVAGDGGVFSFGSAPFEGSLPLDFSGTKRFDGNYKDFTEIIKDLLLWAGWLLHGASDTQQAGFPVYGNLESTGTFAEDAFPPDAFDKKPIIDGINAVKEIVGFQFWIDEEGGARFESPNWYTFGNFIQETGGRTGQIPTIDERLHLTQYGLSYVDRPVRTEMIVTSDDPTRGSDTTITTRLVPTNPLLTQLFRGMVRPAMLPVPLTVTKAQQEDMARLIEIHMSFQLLQGQMSCVANPAVQINDQVRVYERVTGDTDVHYVRGVSSSHDLDSGVWTYELTTNRLGAGVTGAISG